MSILKRGLSGEPVKLLQAKLGVTADGAFGPGTEKALKEWQAKNGLAADGIAGPDTFSAMGLNELVLLRVGSRGATVKKMQQALGISADGAFGPGTKKAVMEFQKANGLAADGMAGPATLAKMSAFAKDFTAATVAAAELPADFQLPEPTMLPPLTEADLGVPAAGGKTAAAGAAEAPPERSVWGTIKGWFG